MGFNSALKRFKVSFLLIYIFFGLINTLKMEYIQFLLICCNRWPLFLLYVCLFYVQGSVRHEYMSIIFQKDATIYSLFISVNCCTCFAWYLHPSSGAHITVSTASGISVNALQTFVDVSKPTMLTTGCSTVTLMPDAVDTVI
jgi:hypothetical protein